MSDIGLFEAIHSARAIRPPRPDPVPEELITRAPDTAILAPTGNAQNCSFVVRDADKRRRLGAVYNRQHVHPPIALWHESTPLHVRLATPGRQTLPSNRANRISNEGPQPAHPDRIPFHRTVKTTPSASLPNNETSGARPLQCRVRQRLTITRTRSLTLPDIKGRGVQMDWRRHLKSASAVTLTLTIAATLPAAAESPTERGDYLVNSIAACGNCHTRDAANHLPGGELSGGFGFADAVGQITGPNITPDPQTGIGEWTDAQIITALRDGKRPNGTIIGPPMPFVAYRQLSDNDSAAIAAYLRSLKPVDHTVARSQYNIQLPPSYGPPVTHVPEPTQGTTVAYGAYLATVGHCVLYHTAPGKDRPFDMTRAYAGGRMLPDIRMPGAFVRSRNITSDPEHGIGKWSNDQIKQTIVSGVRPDGTMLAPTMPFAWYAKMTPQDLDAVVLFLRTVQPIKDTAN